MFGVGVRGSYSIAGAKQQYFSWFSDDGPCRAGTAPGSGTRGSTSRRTSGAPSTTQVMCYC